MFVCHVWLFSYAIGCIPWYITKPPGTLIAVAISDYTPPPQDRATYRLNQARGQLDNNLFAIHNIILLRCQQL